MRIDTARFTEVFKKGKTYNTSLYMVKYLTKQTEARCAVVVSKKIYPKAHDRNKLKRSIYKTISENISSTQTPHVIFMVKKPIKQAQPEDIMREVALALNSLR